MNDSASSSLSPVLADQSALPLNRWYEGLAQYQQLGVAHVLATIVAVNGSAPRALQAKMVITSDTCCDTLGGGGLEYDVTTTARQLLNGEIETTLSKPLPNKQDKEAVRRDAVFTKHYPLGAKLAQCCGGSVTVMFECFNITPPLSILVFGAGHVAAALMTILAKLPCQVDWVDSRAEMFASYLLNPNFLNATEQLSTSELNTTEQQKPLNVNDDTSHQKAIYRLPAHIRPHVSDEPVDFIRPFIERLNEQNGQRFVLIMTHDHALDFELVRAAVDACLDSDINKAENSAVNDCSNVNQKILKPYIGCISSATKAKRFKDRLLQRGYTEQSIDNVIMPIGLPIGGKEPMAVAVSIAADILQRYHQS